MKKDSHIKKDNGSSKQSENNQQHGNSEFLSITTLNINIGGPKKFIWILPCYRKTGMKFLANLID